MLTPVIFSLSYQTFINEYLKKNTFQKDTTKSYIRIWDHFGDHSITVNCRTKVSIIDLFVKSLYSGKGPRTIYGRNRKVKSRKLFALGANIFKKNVLNINAPWELKCGDIYLTWFAGNDKKQSSTGNWACGFLTVLKSKVGNPTSTATGQMHPMAINILFLLHSICALIGWTIATYLQIKINVTIFRKIQVQMFILLNGIRKQMKK